tara:strand:+ start:617 stop:721 length:105 start_codon:yes stop_codon:yes gene_type:complete
MWIDMQIDYLSLVIDYGNAEKSYLTHTFTQTTPL